jgi:hypothetical protein
MGNTDETQRADSGEVFLKHADPFPISYRRGALCAPIAGSEMELQSQTQFDDLPDKFYAA